jgi:hypothetical protein
LKNYRKVQKKNELSGNKTFGEKSPEFSAAIEKV